MTGAMYAAISGLKAHMNALNVIGNNISNVNTLAYKATRYTFNEALYTTSRSGSDGTSQMGGQNPAQIGYGSSVGTIDVDMSSKNYTPTGMAMDCMIDGDGFFLLGDDKTKSGVTTQEEAQGMLLSRLGNFNFDSQGFLVDGNGSLVYGFLRGRGSMTDAEEEAGELTEGDLTFNALTPIRLPMCTVTTDEETQRTMTTIEWPELKSTTIGEGENTQTIYSIVDSDKAGVERLQASTISIDKTGAITAMTKDEQLIVVGYVAIAQVDNPNGVTHTDGRYYQALGGAGNVHLTTVGGSLTYVASEDHTKKEGGVDYAASEINIESGGDTALVTGGLESSGTDLATEITNMITIQRGYQANTRIVTVTDSMLEELVNMKR